MRQERQLIADPGSTAIATALDDLVQRIVTPMDGLGPAISILQFKQFARLASRQAITLDGARCIDFGCGAMRPYNISSLLYLAGAAEVMGIDFEAPFDLGGNAIGVLSTLMAVALDGLGDDVAGIAPNFRRLSRRIGGFDWARLVRGDIGGVPRRIEHRVGNYLDLPPRKRQFDVMVSNSVFEHVDDLPACLAVFRESIGEDGAIYASIDYRDHRVYTEGASMWQYLIDGGDYRPGYINKLRHSEMVALIERSGFALAECEIVRQPPDEAERARFLPAHDAITAADIEITEARVLLRPA